MIGQKLYLSNFHMALTVGATGWSPIVFHRRYCDYKPLTFCDLLGRDSGWEVATT